MTKEPDWNAHGIDKEILSNSLRHLADQIDANIVVPKLASLTTENRSREWERHRFIVEFNTKGISPVGFAKNIGPKDDA